MDNRINIPPRNSFQAAENSLDSLKSFVEKIKHKEDKFEQDINNHLKALAEGKYGKPAHEQIKKFRDGAREMATSAPSDVFAQTAEKLASAFYVEYLRTAKNRVQEDVVGERRALESVEAELLLEELTKQLGNAYSGGQRLVDGPEEKLAEAVADELKRMSSISFSTIHRLELESRKPTTDPILKVFPRAVEIHNKSFEKGGG
jgi:hypothetical protein